MSRKARGGSIALLFTVLAALATPADARQNTPDSAGVQPPFFLTGRADDEPIWAPLIRLREAEAVYKDRTEWWGTYVQLRAVAEAAVGNHGAALRALDAGYPAAGSAPALPEGTRAVAALDVLASAADTARVIMINERHHAASDRLLTLELLPILRAKGYRYLAAETFSWRDTTLNSRAYPVEGFTGIYTDEPVFAEVVREALRLGFTLVPYEFEGREAEEGLTLQQTRDRAQAQNLADRIFRDDPDARVLVHAGYAHVKEKAEENWYPMAVYFRETTGIDPYTVDQTTLSERSDPAREHPRYREAVARGLLRQRAVVLVASDGEPLAPVDYPVDLHVLSPRTTYTMNRPEWMALDGRRTPTDVPTPECINRLCFVEARIVGEPEEAVPLDRTEVVDAGTARLFLPAGTRVRVRIVAADGEVLNPSVLER